MPNRIIKETICTSDSINGLSWFAEVLFYRLIVACDDYGRYDGRIAVIKNKLFPLKDDLTARTVEEAVKQLVSAGLVVLYMHEDKPFLYLPTWNDHQIIRAKKSKYPAPADNLQASEIICKQMQANVPEDDNTIQSNTKSNPNTNTTTETTEAVAVVVHLFEQIKGQPLTGYECEKLKDLVGEYDQVWVADALRKMADAGKIKLNYAEGVLRNWKTEGRDHRKGDKTIKGSTNYDLAYQ